MNDIVNIVKQAMDSHTLEPDEATKIARTGVKKRKSAVKQEYDRLKREYEHLTKLGSNNPDIQAILDAKQQQLDQLHTQMLDLDEELREINAAQRQEMEEKIEHALAVVNGQYIQQDATAAYIIKDQEFVYITDYSTTPEKQNVQVCNLEPNKFVEVLANDLKLCSWHLPVPRLKHLFSQVGRTFHISRYSIDPKLWKDEKVYLPIRHMEQYFIDKFELTPEQMAKGQEAIKYFDWLMWSLSGGKQENQDHIEQWILHKILNYHKAVTTPDLVIVGHIGGNGKGILMAIIRLMFPATLSGKANSKTLNGNFNAIMMGKLIVFFDDQNSREIPLEIVKQLAGSETMIFEPKGKDQYEGEKTHSSAWFNNKLPFPLTPAGQEGGVDRRFSIMRTNITFLESIRKHHAEESGEEPTVEESKEMAEVIVSDYLLNRVCVAAWFQELRRRHPQVDQHFTLKALHGEDYNYFLATQQDSLEQIFHGLIDDCLRSGECVPIFVIKEVLRHLDGKAPGDKSLGKKVTEICSQYKHDIVIERVMIDIKSDQRRIKKQCSVVRLKGPNWRAEFDWDRVSDQPYTGKVLTGQELIPEENLMFGVVRDDSVSRKDIWEE